MEKRELMLILLCTILIVSCFGVFAKEGGQSGGTNSGGGRVSSSNSNRINGPPGKIVIENRGDMKKIRTEKPEGIGEVGTKLDVEQEDIGNETRLQVKSNSGYKKEIKILPDRASYIAIERFKSDNITVVLKTVGNGSSQRIIYDIEANKTGKFLGIFKVKLKERVQVDAESGNATNIKRPWWSMLVSGKKKDQTSKKTIICHIPQDGLPNTINIGSPAVNAHLAHGDYLGPCSTANNETKNETNQTSQLYLEIINPISKTYNITTITINISSNGFVSYSIDNSTQENYSAEFDRIFEKGNHTIEASAIKDNESLSKKVDFVIDPEYNPGNFSAL